MKKRALLGCILFVLGVIGGAACARADLPQLPAEPAHIVGTVETLDLIEPDTSVAKAQRVLARLYVEGEPGREMTYDKAAVTVTAATVMRQDGQVAMADDLQVGQTVQVWFGGPVAESYPVQGTAAHLVIGAP